MDNKNYYEILGLENGADLQQVKKAYRKLSTKFHPDKNDGDEYFAKMYLKIKEAYDYLASNVEQNMSDNEKNNSSFSSFENIYLELRELRFKLGGGTVFDDLEQLICERITKGLLTLSKQDELIKSENSAQIRKIIDEVYVIFAYIKNERYYQKLSTIVMNLTGSGPIASYSIRVALNMKRRGQHGKLITNK